MSIIKLMESKKNLVLVGMMGSGKSTIGSILAKKLDFELLDIDKIIEKNESSTISNIFINNGEDYFRKIEEKITIENLKLQNKVISLGGGAFINTNIQKKVLKSSISFWLNLKKSTIIKRIFNSKKRPLVKNLSEKNIKKLIYDRNVFYKKAHYQINCDNLNKTQIAEKIIKIYEKL